MPNAMIKTSRSYLDGSRGTVPVERVATPIGVYWRSDAKRASIVSVFEKQADIGGDPDGQFEQAFSSLAYTYIKDKAPQLLDKLVGFQLLERNEDSTKALGVFGAKLGSQWIFLPVIFLNNELKGHELLYVKNQNTFLPLKENWVNYLVGQQPQLLGEESTLDAYHLGGMAPDISRLANLPGLGKMGFDRWVLPFLPVYAAMKTASDSYLAAEAGLAPRLDLRAFAARDVFAAGAVLKAASEYPEFKRSLDRFYGPGMLAEVGRDLYARAVREKSAVIASTPPMPAPRPAGLLSDPQVKRAVAIEEGKAKLKVYADVNLTRNAPELTDDERGRMLKDKVLIVDKRDPWATSVVYDTQLNQRLTNPRGSGIYNVLERPGTFNRCLVATYPHSHRGREDFATVVRLTDGTKPWLNVHGTAVWANGVEEAEDFRAWWGGLPDSKSLEDGATYMAVAERGDASIPFTVRNGYGENVYRVDYENDSRHDWRRSTTLPTMADRWDSTVYPSGYGALLRIGDRPGTKLRSVRGELLVPSNYKFLKLRDGRDNLSDGDPIVPGELADIQTLFSTKTAALEVRSTGTDYSVGGVDRVPYNAALVHLVRDHGVTEKAAREVLSAARDKRRAVFRVKYADGYGPTLRPGPDAPAFPPPYYGIEYNGPNAVNATYDQSEYLPVPSLDSARTDPAIYDPWRNYRYDERAMGAAQQHGAAGRKELFDASALAGMLGSVGKGTLVDQYLPDLFKALGKLGKTLFLFYWQQDAFADRYGQQDLPELEDALRNSFEMLGDVVLFLKQKTVGPLFDRLGGELAVTEAALN